MCIKVGLYAAICDFCDDICMLCLINLQAEMMAVNARMKTDKVAMGDDDDEEEEDVSNLRRRAIRFVHFHPLAIK